MRRGFTAHLLEPAFRLLDGDLVRDMYNITFTQQTTEKQMTTAHEELQARRQIVMANMSVIKSQIERKVRYVRSENYWVKITRDNKSFCFAKGRVGQLQTSDIETYSFTWVANWKEAIEKAKSTLAWIEI